MYIADQDEYVAKTKGNVPKIVQDINTYADALLVLGEQAKSAASATDKLLKIIEAANYIDNANRGWCADFGNSTYYKYIPWLIKRGSVWSLDSVIGYTSVTYCPVGFYYKERSTAELLAKKHIDLYNQVWG